MVGRLESVRQLANLKPSALSSFLASTDFVRMLNQALLVEQPK